MNNNTELWTQYKKNPNWETKKQIIMNYKNLVHYVIHNSRFAHLNFVDEKDHFQFGVEGLSEAIDRFDPEFGTKFETYAIQRIRGKIIDELRKLQIKPRTNLNEDNEPIYKNVPFEGEKGEDGVSLTELIPSEAEYPDQAADSKEEKELLVEAIKDLNERDRTIISLYYYEYLNYREIAEVLNITVSRVSQLHSKIIKELKEKLQLAYE